MEFKDLDFMAVIIGGDINAYSVARSFHEAYQIKSLAISKKRKMGPVIDSKIIINHFEENMEDPTIFEKTLINIANQYKHKKLILYACGDWYVKMILERKEKLGKHYIIPTINLNLMDKITKKDYFYQLCEQLDIDYPQTFVYDTKKKNKIKLPFNYPIAAKPADSVSYHYAKFQGKKKGYKFNHPEELQTMLTNLETSSYNGKIIIQDFIPGDDSNMRVLTCYCDQHHDVKLFALGHVLLEEHTPSAVGNYVAIINEINHDIFDQAQKFLKHIKYVGFANFDLKYDSRDGKYKFFEINTRLGRSNFYIGGSGFNTAQYVVDEYIYHKPLTPVIADNETLYLAVPPYVIYKYVKDKNLKNQVRKLLKQKKYCYPLIYKPDNHLKRTIYTYLSIYNQIRKFKKYY